MMVSEISIPVPILSKNPADLSTAATLQPFTDHTGGRVDFSGMDLPIADLAILDGRLHFIFGQHFQGFEPAAGSAALALSAPAPEGPYRLGDYTNYATNDYLFEIPSEWAAIFNPEMRLAAGRFREGVWGGGGPTLFAIDPNAISGDSLSAVTPLLLYGRQEPDNPEIRFDSSMQMNSYQLADHWSGGAWLTAGDRSAVVFLGTKALGESWYGFANGVIWEYDCADQEPDTCPDVPEWPYDNRGYWAEDFEAQLLFYDPADLAAVARGELESWEPQPYAFLSLNDFLLAPEINLAEYKRDLVGAAAFDPDHGLLYIIERLADDYRSVIHVFHIRP
jgi:hypothetical protein